MTSTNKRDGREVELLPLPEATGNQIVLRGDDFQGDYNFYVSAFTARQMQDYARACVERALAESRAEVEEWKRVASAQAGLHDESEARAERLAGALQWYVDNDDTNEGQEGNEFWIAGRDRARAALEQEPQE